MPFDRERFDQFKKDLHVNALAIVLSIAAIGFINTAAESYKQNEILKEQNNLERTKNATEFEQLESVKSEIKFKNPQELGIKVEQYGGKVLKVIEYEGELKINNPILQKAMQIVAEKAGTNRWRMSAVYASPRILIVEKTPSNKTTEIKALIDGLGLNVSFAPISGIVGKKAVTDGGVNTDQDFRPVGTVNGKQKLTPEQFNFLTQALRMNLGDGAKIFGSDQSSGNVSGILVVPNNH